MDPKYIFSSNYSEPILENTEKSEFRKREAIKKDIKKEELELPSKSEMAKNVAKSLVKTIKSVASGDGVSTDDENRSKRLKACLSCSWYIKERQRCAKCGCVVPLKVYLANETCPIGKW
tara:strand:- start:23 stop:379 length:357 start_codon:yes stop_codon:yes gene_type:complete